MPTLHWIGKEKVVGHHRDVPFKVLEHQYGFDRQNSSTSIEKHHIIFKKRPRDISRF